VCASFKYLVFNRLKKRSQSTKRAFPVKCIRRFTPRVEESNLGQLCVLWWISKGAKLRKETRTDYALNGNLNIKMFLRKQKQTTHQIKGGPEPRWKINSRDLRIEKWGLIFGPFFLIWYKIPVWFVLRTCFTSAISFRPCGTRKFPQKCKKIAGCSECAVHGSRPSIASTPGSSPPERPGLDNTTNESTLRQLAPAPPLEVFTSTLSRSCCLKRQGKVLEAVVHYK